MEFTRRQARESAIQMLTAADLNPPEDAERFLGEFWEQRRSLAAEEGGEEGEPKARMRRFAEERFNGVTAHRDEIDAILVPLLENWDLVRLGTVERAVLRLGVWEIGFADVPAPVAINEAIDIANWFSSPKSRTLVNAVLDKYAKSR